MVPCRHTNTTACYPRVTNFMQTRSSMAPGMRAGLPTPCIAALMCASYTAVPSPFCRLRLIAGPTPVYTAAVALFLVVFFNRRGEASLLSPSSTSSVMLTLVGTRPGRHAFLCNGRRLPLTSGGRSSTATCRSISDVRSRHGGGCTSSIGSSRTTHRRRQLCAISSAGGHSKQLPSIAAPHHGSTRLGLARRLGGFATSTTEMRASARPPSEEESTMSSAEIAAGTRVRLRDTGRLGTVVGKKAGGWWKVDLLETWNGGDAAELADGVGATAGNDAASPTTGSGPVSTRRVNMEPLGNAYASSSEATPVTVAAAAAAAAAPPTGNVVGARKRRVSSTKSSSSSSGRAATTRSADTDTAAAPPAARGKAATTKRRTAKKAGAGAGDAAAASPAVVPPSLVGQTISLEIPAPSVAAAVPEGGAEEVAVTIGKMSSEGLAHAAMKEWLVFSDLHVSPGSLGVTLEVGYPFIHAMLACPSG